MSGSSLANFSQAVELYKTNYVQYRTTGRSENKLAYEAAQRWIESYLASLDRSIANNAQSISKFVNEYSNASPELADLQQRMTAIRKEGPTLENKYATIKRVNEEQPVIDRTDLYVKAGIAAGLLGVIIAVSL
jgi:chromosome segregation ATPase